ncbi:MAG TPA: hypothetical protein PLJ00_16190 [Chitinophagales bacterium]|nr:hypothetical protein [Chitinophagales bacterium]
MSLTIIEKSRQELLDSLKKESVFARSAAELKAEYLSLIIADVNDKEGALKVATARKHMVKIRTTLDKFRKSVTKPLTDAKKEVDKTAADMQAEFDVIEKHLQDEEGKIQRELDLIETKRKDAIRSRHAALNECGMFLREDTFVCTSFADGVEDLTIPLHFVGSTTVDFNQVWPDDKFQEFVTKAAKRRDEINELLKKSSAPVQPQPEQKFDITKQDEVPEALKKFVDDEVPEAFMKKSSPLTTKDPNRKFINNVSIVDYCEMLGFVKVIPDGTRMYYLDGNWITKTNNNEKLLMTKMEIAKLSDIPESGEVEHLLLAAVYKIAEITKCTADEALQLIINYRQLIF